MAGEPEGQGLPRRADEEALDPIRAYDHMADARLISEAQVCQRGRRGSPGHCMERGSSGVGEPMDGSLRRDQCRIDIGTETVTLAVDAQDLAFWDAAAASFEVEMTDTPSRSARASNSSILTFAQYL